MGSVFADGITQKVILGLLAILLLLPFFEVDRVDDSSQFAIELLESELKNNLNSTTQGIQSNYATLFENSIGIIEGHHDILQLTITSNGTVYTLWTETNSYICK